MARRSRRKDRRITVGLVAAGLAVAVLLGLVINGIVSGATSSTGYLQLVNRSFAAQGNAIFQQQNVDGAQLTRVLTRAPLESRRVLQQQLDLLVRSTSAQVEQAKNATSPSPSGDLGPRFVRIVSERAQGVSGIRSAIDGLLGMTPLPIAGSPRATPIAPPPLISSTEAITQLTHAGALISTADAAVLGLRQAVAAAPGSAQLIHSVFIKDPSLLEAPAMNAFVGSLESSTSLTIVHELNLLAVALRPAALPTPNSQVTNLPPTTKVVVTAVVRNLGNVAERPVVVTASVTPVSGGVADSVTISTQVGAEGVVSVTLPALSVRPGTTVSLQVAVSPPAGQAGTAPLSQTQTLVIAPATSSLG